MSSPKDKARPMNSGLSVLLALRLSAWHRKLPSKVAGDFYPFWLPVRRPFTVVVAINGSALIDGTKFPGSHRKAIAAGWIREYAEHPDYTLQAMRRIRDAVHHPRTKTEAIELRLLTRGADDKDEAIAADVERVFNFQRATGSSITGEDVKKARQKLARKEIVRLSVSVGRSHGTLAEIVKGKITKGDSP